MFAICLSNESVWTILLRPHVSTQCTQAPFTKVFSSEPDHARGIQSTRGIISIICNGRTAGKRQQILRLLLAGEIKGIVRGGGTLSNVTRETGGQNLSFLMGEYSQKVLDEGTNLIPITTVSVDLLQMSYHVHDIDKTIVEDLLLFLELLDEFVNVIDGAFALGACISFGDDGIRLLLA